MNDEDLRKTVADIRQASHDVDMVKSMLETAADEIEHLVARVKSAEAALEKFDYTDGHFYKYPDREGEERPERVTP